MQARDVIQAARRAGRKSLSEADGKALLTAFGVKVPRCALVVDAAAAGTAIAGLAPPFAVKVVSPDILHKSDVGGVRLGLRNAGEVEAALADMARQPAITAARIDGFLVEEMAPAGTELVIGGLQDPQFGPLIMVGLGGILVEVLKDVAFRLCPITPLDAEAMLDELRGAAILAGTRGRPAADRAAVIDALLRIGGRDGLLMTLRDDVAELDVNPLIASPSGAVAADARIILREQAGAEPGAARWPHDDRPVLERFAPLFAPRTVAVLGASTTSVAIANTFIRRMKAFGYDGSLYPIHPQAEAVEGLKAYPSLAATPEPIDYAYVAVGAERIPDLLAAAAGRVRFAQVISSGFGEIEGGQALERKLVVKAHEGGCRVIGPNCLGMYSPRGKLTFPADAPSELGTVGVVSQSGGLSTDIIKRGQWRGVRFSGLVTVGNSADIGPVDLLEFYLADPNTKVIGMYLEDVEDGRAFFDLLRSTATPKPVVILKGGRSRLGRAAAASHTGAIAGDNRAWEALTRQTACVMVATIDEFIDALLAFQFLEPRPAKPTRVAVLFGNGGGTSVLATDFFESVGLEVRPFDAALHRRLEELRLPPGTSVANPIDTPVRTLQEEEGRIAKRILDLVYEGAELDAMVMHLNLASFVGRGGVDPIDNLIAAAVEVQNTHPGRAHFVMALRVDGSPQLDARKRSYGDRARAAGIPVYDELAPAAQALACVQRIERQLARATR